MPDPLTTAATAWAWDKYGKSLTDEAASNLKDLWDKFRWNDAAEKYRAKVKKLCGNMQIMGMAESVPLDNIFTEAYLLDKPTAFRRFDIERLKESLKDPDAPLADAKRVGGLTLINSNKNLFILGKPGAGKTTFLKYIALQAAEPEKPIVDKVPIFISLKRWADSGMDLMPFIVEQFDKCDFPDAGTFVKKLLKSGGAIVLFDGLDEVNLESGQRDAQTLSMKDFIERYDLTQCLITCRVAASVYYFQSFVYAEVADFTEKQIQTFVVNWFRNQEGERDKDTSKKFLEEFTREDNRGLRDLARTPLLLTLLCLAFDATLTFPRRRVEIYEEALDALLKKWDSSRRIKRDEVYRKLSLGHKENMLARIAAETFERNQYFIPQEELERHITEYVKNVPPHGTSEGIDGETILKAIEVQHGVFVERARRVYSFSHLTFQEYLTAKYVVGNATEAVLSNLIEHCTDERWREVILLTVSLLPDARQFMKTFRHVVDGLLGGDERLRASLSWADGKSAPVKGVAWRLRLFYLEFELSLYCNGSAEKQQRLSTAIASVRYDLDDTEANLRHYLELDVRLIYEFARVNSFSYIYTPPSTAAEQLRASVAAAIATGEGWEGIVQEAQDLMLMRGGHRHELDLTESQRQRLSDFLKASILLRDCLDMAVMPPDEKRAMLDTLYLPATHAGEGMAEGR